MKILAPILITATTFACLSGTESLGQESSDDAQEVTQHVQTAVREAQAAVQKAQSQAQVQMDKVRREIEANSARVAQTLPRIEERLRAVIGSKSSRTSRTLVISSADDPTERADLEEDLAVMSHIFDKTIDSTADNGHRRTAMGIDVLLGPGSAPLRSLYLEGYGAVFLVNVNFPLLPPPAEPAEQKEKTPVESTWQEAKRELYDQPNGGGFGTSNDSIKTFPLRRRGGS